MLNPIRTLEEHLAKYFPSSNEAPTYLLKKIHEGHSQGEFIKDIFRRINIQITK